jgi:signal peptidase I
MEILKKIYYFILDIAQTLILAVAAFVIVYMFLFRPFQVKGESMFPTYHDSEYLITNIISQRFGSNKLGDVIVFKAPNAPEKDYIKRVIGVPGDKVMIKDEQVYLNGKLLDESAFLKPEVKTYGGSFAHEGEEILVPNDNLFVLGDNRSYSSDSREWGFVPKKNIIGTAIIVYWPINRAGIINNPF